MNDDYYKQIFSQNLNRYMKLYGIKQAEIARRVGVSKATVHDWVFGNMIPKMDKIDILCQIFGIGRRQLLERQESVDENATAKTRLIHIIETISDNEAEALLFLLEARLGRK